MESAGVPQLKIAQSELAEEAGVDLLIYIVVFIAYL
jgi:hypothetical protein